MIPSDRNKPHPFRPLGLLILSVTAAAVALWLVRLPGDSRRARLALVEHWTYQLQDFAAAMGRVTRSDSDMLVIDYAVDSGDGLKPLTRAKVDKLKRKPDGGRRLVIAYFSIGEAEEYRPYWHAAWRDAPPDWIVAENCRWPKNYLVKFWDSGWRDIVFEGAHSYLEAIQDAGFDGVYLDRVDVYADIADRFPKSRQRMISFVKDLASSARARDPGFLVIVQNAEELLDDATYRAAIDGVAKEDLLYGVTDTGKRNPKSMVTETTRLLDTLKEDGKPVFAVEYLTSADAIAQAKSELEDLDYVGVFPSRALDGSDPAKVHASSSAAAEREEAEEPDTGTPEYAAANCDGVWKRAQEPKREAEALSAHVPSGARVPPAAAAK